MQLTQPLHALLIGIDAYSPSGSPIDDPDDGAPTIYSDLYGSVRDVQRMSLFLRDELGVPPSCIHTLTAPLTESTAPEERPRELPTYEGILAAWRRLSDRARAGDQVLVHYSGHGGRVPTIAPTIKPNGLDETLVPCN
ncbi:MAG: caspase family protein, partial [Acidobacteriota bacterium]